MGTYVRLVGLLGALLLVGCSMGGNGLQVQVDNANRQSLQAPEARTYVMMFWDDKPQEWLMVNDSVSIEGTVVQFGAYITFLGGRLDRDSRQWILEEKEIMPPTPLSFMHAEPMAKRQAYYDESAAKVAKGVKWSGRSLTTTIHPKAVPYRDLGTVEWDGRRIRLLGGDVTTDREADSLALYPRVRTVVGLDAETGALVFEYIANLEPWTRQGYANRMLSVIDRSDYMLLHSAFGQSPADERSRHYLELRARLVELESVLNVKAALHDIKRPAG